MTSIILNMVAIAFVLMALLADLGHEAAGNYRPTVPQRLFLWAWAILTIYVIWAK